MLAWASDGVGRTGRAGKTGVAVTFLDNNDEEVMYVPRPLSPPFYPPPTDSLLLELKRYDLKSEIQKSDRSTLDPELARHPAAQARIVGADKYKRKRAKGENDD